MAWDYNKNHMDGIQKVDFNEQFLKDYFSRQADIEFVLLFGSFASGHVSPMSDIDVALYFGGERKALELADRQIDITCALMRFCKISRVDAVVLNTAHPFLRFQAVKYGRLLYVKDEKMFYCFKANTLGEYQDIRPMYDLYDKMARNSLMKYGG